MIFDEQLWWRLPKEPRRAFQAFQIYCGLGRSRSLAEAARRFRHRLGADKDGMVGVPFLFQRWYTEWAWAERTHACDRDCARQERIEEETYRHEQARKRMLEEFKLVGHIFRLQLIIAELIEKQLSGSYETITVRKTNGHAMTTQLNNKLKNLVVLCDLEQKLGEVASHFDTRFLPPFGPVRNGKAA
jgi:hypothetical protein